MKAQISNITPYAAAPLDDVPASVTATAHKVVSFIAAILVTSFGLAALSSSPQMRPVSEINGVKVIDLAPVQVHPSAAEVRAATLLADVEIPTAITWVARPGTGAGLLGAQLSMPYYSFGNKFGRISNKE